MVFKGIIKPKNIMLPKLISSVFLQSVSTAMGDFFSRQSLASEDTLTTVCPQNPAERAKNFEPLILLEFFQPWIASTVPLKPYPQIVTPNKIYIQFIKTYIYTPKI